MTQITTNKAFLMGNLLVTPTQNQLELVSPDELSASPETPITKIPALKSLKIQPKAMEVLAYLAANYQRVVSAQELMDKLWAGRVVTPGSVQKSINTLRSAFNEMIGEQEVIVHYSKRGYQFQLAPKYIETESETKNVAHDTIQRKTNRIAFKYPLIILIIIAIASVAAFFVIVQSKAPSVSINHKTKFTSIDGFTLETGHERNPTPHPNNRDLAYIKEKLVSLGDRNEIESEILIRNQQGKDWHLSKSTGSWFKLAWSPSGNQLAAVEVKSPDGPPRRPNFYEKPNFLYSFHIFTLDLAKDQLIEKQQLSQWQGRIYSLTWWNEDTLEIVAKQGANGINGRFRYSSLDQQISQLDEVEGTGSPISSTVLNKITALQSQKQNSIQIDFLDENQKSIFQKKFDMLPLEMSWIPDGSGVLLSSDEEQKLFELYMNGEQNEIPINTAKDKIFSRIKYGPMGDQIYYTEEQRASNIELVDLQLSSAWITSDKNLNYGASYSSDSEKVAYASVRNNQTHLWLLQQGLELQLTKVAIPKRVNSIVWSEDDMHITFSAGNALYLYHMKDAITEQILNDKNKIESIAVSPEKNKIYFVKTINDVRNLWAIDIQSIQQKQLTFGSIASAIPVKGDIYFQYLGENGIWAWRSRTQNLEQVSTELLPNTKLLAANEKGVFYINGGQCNESGVEYFSFETSRSSLLLKRPSKFVSTSSFHPNKGILQTRCYLPESNIVLMK